MADKFYENLADDADDKWSDSDTSIVDPIATANSLKGLNEMDSKLFGSKPSTDTKESLKSSGLVKKQTSFLDDEMDDLDDIINSTDFKANSNTNNKNYNKNEKHKEAPEATKHSPFIENKPLKSEVEVKSKPKDHVFFSDDDDPLSAISPRPVSSKEKTAVSLDNDEAMAPGVSILETLLAPSTSSNITKSSERKDFVLDNKYLSGSGSTMPVEDNFWNDSAYRPSTATVGKSRRAVHFIENERPVTAPLTSQIERKSGGAPKKDWLGGDGDEIDLDKLIPEQINKKEPVASIATDEKSNFGKEKFVSRFELDEPKLSTPTFDPVQTLQPKNADFMAQPVSTARISQINTTSTINNRRSSVTRLDLSKPPSTNASSNERHVMNLADNHDNFLSSTVLDQGFLASENAPKSGAQLAEQFRDQRQIESLQRQTAASAASNLNFSLGESSALGMEYENKIKKLQLEKEHLQTVIDILKRRHADEIELVEKSHKKQVQILEDTFQQREQRLNRESELLTKQNTQHVDAIEQERAEMRADISRQRSAVEEENSKVIKRMKEAHQIEVEQLRKEHVVALDRQRQAHQEEICTLANSQSHTSTLQKVLDRMAESAQGLGVAQQLVSEQQKGDLDERRSQIVVKEEVLRKLEERLHQQEQETQRERQRLQELMARLELQMRESARCAEEERWKARQESNKASAVTAALEEERRVIAESLQHERQELERSRQTMLMDQKQQLKQLLEKDKLLSEERAQFAKQLEKLLERQNLDMAQSAKDEVEREAELRTLGEERRRLVALDEELKDKVQQLKLDKYRVERDHLWIESEKSRLESIDADLQARAQELDIREMDAHQALTQGERSLSTAKHFEKNQDTRLADIHSQLQQLAEKERFVAEERALLAKERQELESTRMSQLCVNCRTPVHDSSSVDQVLSNGYNNVSGSFASQTLRELLQRSNGAIPSSSLNLEDFKHGSVQRAEHLAANLSAELVRQAYLVESEQDREYLAEERLYLQALRGTPYHKNG